MKDPKDDPTELELNAPDHAGGIPKPSPSLIMRAIDSVDTLWPGDLPQPSKSAKPASPPSASPAKPAPPPTETQPIDDSSAPTLRMGFTEKPSQDPTVREQAAPPPPKLTEIPPASAAVPIPGSTSAAPASPTAPTSRIQPRPPKPKAFPIVPVLSAALAAAITVIVWLLMRR